MFSQKWWSANYHALRTLSYCAPNAWELPPITNQLINPSMSNCPGTGYFGSIQHKQDIYVSCILVQHKPYTHYIQHLQHMYFLLMGIQCILYIHTHLHGNRRSQNLLHNETADPSVNVREPANKPCSNSYSYILIHIVIF